VPSRYRGGGFHFLQVLFFAFVVIFALALYFSLPSRRDFSLYRKHALVTGGSKGIGKQISIQLLHEGCHVTIVARLRDSLFVEVSERRMT